MGLNPISGGGQGSAFQDVKKAPVCENTRIFVMLGYLAYTQSRGCQSPLAFTFCLCFYAL